MGIAAGWSRIFTTGLTIMRLHLLRLTTREWGPTSSAFGGKKFRYVGILKKKDLHHSMFNKCASSFQDDLVKRLNRVDVKVTKLGLRKLRFPPK